MATCAMYYDAHPQIEILAKQKATAEELLARAESNGYRGVQKSGDVRFFAAHLTSGACRGYFPQYLSQLVECGLYRLLLMFGNVAGAMLMKYYDSVRNTVEMCPRVAPRAANGNWRLRAWKMVYCDHFVSLDALLYNETKYTISQLNPWYVAHVGSDSKNREFGIEVCGKKVDIARLLHIPI